MTAPRSVSLITSLSILSLAAAISSKSLDSRGVPSDVKYIQCETCSELSKSAAVKAQELEGKSVTELRMLDLVESLCDPTSSYGRWMRTIDLVERLGRLRLIQQDGEQDCTQECRTIGLACRAVVDGYETELAEKLYAMRKKGDVNAKDLGSWLCERKSGLSGACLKRPPQLPKDREKGPEFKKKDAKAAEMDNLMEQMRAMNGGKDLGMQMFSKDQMAGGMPGMGSTEGDDDDDDDDDDSDDEDENEDAEEAESANGGEGEVNSLDDTSLGDGDSASLNEMDGLSNPGSDAAKAASTANEGSDEL